MTKAKQKGSIKELKDRSPRTLPNGTKVYAYQCVLYIGLDVLKKERRLTKVLWAKNATEAGKMSAAVFADLRARATAATDAKGTVGQLADAWLKAKRVKGASPATLDGVASHVASIKRHMGTVKVADLKGEHVDAWLDVLRTERTARPRTEATIHHYFATLRTMLRWARRKHLAQIVATEHADVPEPRRYEARPPTGDAVRVAMEATSGDFKVALEVLVASGMRRGELVGLRWSDLDGVRLRVQRALRETQGGGVSIGPPKSGKSRTVTLTPETVAMLWAHHATLVERSTGLGPDAYMFPALRESADGSEPHRPNWVNQNWTRVQKSTGIKCRPHDLRHWHASELLLAHVPMSVVTARLGHSKESTTADLYSHVLDDFNDNAAAVAQLALGRGTQ